MNVLHTRRLCLRRLCAEDAGFLLELLNEPAFLKHVGDRNLRTSDDASKYILDGPVASYARHGFGVFLVELRESGLPIGICGLIRRDSLDAPDIGYSFLERHWSQGYAYESATAVLQYGRHVLGLDRIVAITSPHNATSIRLLEKLGLHFERTIELPGYAEGKLFATGWTTPGA